MTTVALVLAAVSLAGVVFLAFAYSGLLGVVRQLQDRLEDAAVVDGPRRVDAFAGRQRTFVLVIEPSCASCKDRIDELVDYARGAAGRSKLRLVVLQAAAGTRPSRLPEDIDVEFVSDAALVGRLGVGIAPLGLVFDPDGVEIGRSVLGDRLSFDRMITWAASDNQDRSNGELVGRG